MSESNSPAETKLTIYETREPQPDAAGGKLYFVKTASKRISKAARATRREVIASQRVQNQNAGTPGVFNIQKLNPQ